jgi:hypothetical protein
MSKCFELEPGLTVTGDPEMSDETKTALRELFTVAKDQMKALCPDCLQSPCDVKPTEQEQAEWEQAEAEHCAEVWASMRE